MTDITDKLLPCPFCNSPVALREHNCPTVGWHVTCTGSIDKCGVCPQTLSARANGDISTPFSKEEAIVAWNHRISNETSQWTKEPPTEEGTYWCNVGYDVLPFRVLWGDNRRLKLVVMSFVPNACDMLTDFLKRYPNASWLKIDKPALPEEGIK